MPVAHTPNGDPETYLRHLESAVEEWIRGGLVDVRRIILDAIEHPSDEELAQASKDSQDGSVAYNLQVTEDGPKVTVAPAIPHTEESRAAAEEAAGHAQPATTSTATASGAELADVSKTPGATPDNPEGDSGTTTLGDGEHIIPPEDQNPGGGLV